MTGRRARLAAVAVGVGLVGLAGVWVVAGGAGGAGGAAVSEPVGRALAALVGLVAVAAALARVWTTETDAAAEAFAETPEHAPSDRPLAGRAFAERVATAAETARAEGVDAGVATVRPALRTTVVAVRRRAGDDPAAVERELDDGTWTTDPVAAAALSPSVAPPERALGRRLADWLRPDRAARRRVRRATDAVARVADERLPRVPGADAPRPAPVSRPSAGEVKRSVDGSVVHVPSAEEGAE